MINYKKIEKNYFRNDLQDLIINSSGKPIIVTAKYKHEPNNKWATFTTVRPYILGTKTYTLCNHINILKADINKYIILSEEFHNRKFYIIGYPNIYHHYDCKRGCIGLAHDIKIQPIDLSTKIYKLDNSILEKCFTFSLDTYKRGIVRDSK